MNIERMETLAEVLETPESMPVAFDMCYFVGRMAPGEYFGRPDEKATVEDIRGNPGCGTTCCVGGLACLLFSEAGDRRPNEKQAQELLGLTGKQAGWLFYNYDSYIAEDGMSYITTSQAAAAIRRMVAEHKASLDIVPVP